MYDVAVFAALGWERRAVTDVLAGVEPAGGARRWRGRLADGASCLVVQTGMGAARAGRAAEAVADASCFLACGCAGALAASLAAGDVVVAASIVSLDADGRAGERLPAESAALAAALATAGFRVHVGAVASSPLVLGSVAAKRTAAGSGALAVEMESAGVAAVAQRLGIPFLGLRVILDRAGEAIPEALAVVDEESGELRGVAAAGLALRPWLWPALARLAAQGRTAEDSLRRALAASLGCGRAALRRDPSAAPAGW